MSVPSDPISDMLSRIRNAAAVRHPNVALPSSKSKVAIASILKREGFIKDFEVVAGKPVSTLRIQLLYRGKGPAIRGIKRASRPGLRVYASKGEIPRIFGGLGTAIVSTSAGMMTGNEAWRKGIGGELLCYVW